MEEKMITIICVLSGKGRGVGLVTSFSYRNRQKYNDIVLLCLTQ